MFLSLKSQRQLSDSVTSRYASLVLFQAATVETNNWNPDGSGRFRLNTKVTSLCTSVLNCTVDDEIVGREVKGEPAAGLALPQVTGLYLETSVGAMVDVDPDWQVASEIFGITLKVEGVLEARFVTSAIQSPKRRGRSVYAGLKRSVAPSCGGSRMEQIAEDCFVF